VCGLPVSWIRRFRVTHAGLPLRWIAWAHLFLKDHKRQPKFICSYAAIRA